MKRYPVYKDSEIDFLGDVPESWKVMKLSRFVEKITNGYVGPTRDIMMDKGVPYIQGIHIKNNSVRFTPDGYYYVSEKWSNDHRRTILKENDVLLVQTGSIGEVGIVPKDLEGANCHALIILRANKNYGTGNYLLWTLASKFGYHSLFSIKTGDILHHLNTTRVRDLRIPVPTYVEQERITNYIEYKTHLIDTLIKKKQKKIELLQEQRAAITNHAVTKGLNPNVKMKDSRIEWLGEVPEHWQRMHLKRALSRIDYGISENLSGDGEIKVLTMGHIQDGEIIVPGEGSIEEVDHDLFLEKDDLLFNRTNSRDLVAKVGIFRGHREDRVTFASYLVRLRSNDKAHPEYLNFLLNSSKFISHARSLALHSINQSNLNSTKYTQILIYLPPIDEQIRIVNILVDKTKSIVKAVFAHQKNLDLLKEYRTTLISEVVTGKIDVRDEAIP